jgi:hypothetical protein
MWHRLALVATIMHPREPPYITQMSDFLKIFADKQERELTILPLGRSVNRMKCTA